MNLQIFHLDHIKTYILTVKFKGEYIVLTTDLQN